VIIEAIFSAWSVQSDYKEVFSSRVSSEVQSCQKLRELNCRRFLSIELSRIESSSGDGSRK
jgi:hypothetical protein